MKRPRPYYLDSSQDASSMASLMSVTDQYFVEIDETDRQVLLARTLAGLIDALPEDQRDVICLLMDGVIRPWDEEWAGYREAGRQLGHDHKWVQRQLRAAIESLRAAIEDLPIWTRHLLADRKAVAGGLPEPEACGLLDRLDAIAARLDERGGGDAVA